VARSKVVEAPVATDIRDLSHDGRGVADVDGRRLFVAGALPTERVLIAPQRRRRRYQEADLVDIVEAAPDRVPAPCEYFGICGGCALQHLAYPAQVRFKQRVAAEAFGRLAAAEPERWLEPITGPQWRYRRRARLGVKYVDAKERVLVGFRERAAPLIADMRLCMVLAEPLGEALGDLAAIVEGSTLARRIPQIEVALGDEFGVLVVRALDDPQPCDLDAFRSFGKRLGIDVYLQRGGPGTARSIGACEGTLAYALPDFDLTLEFAPTDFIQINANVNAQMVAAAIDQAELRATDRVLDLYCGLGNFSLPLARHARQVFGVEGEAGLVARAAGNAHRNGIDNARFATADLTNGDWSFLREQWDVVLLDPPRTGAEAAVAAIDRMQPRRVVYVSCHPGTLARDTKTLVGTGSYRLTNARILDMFPHTHHVEVMAVFDRTG
jgi:23S rRNA (uracil1939-C5)-methyltransferase